MSLSLLNVSFCPSFYQFLMNIINMDLGDPVHSTVSNLMLFVHKSNQENGSKCVIQIV